MLARIVRHQLDDAEANLAKYVCISIRLRKCIHTTGGHAIATSDCRRSMMALVLIADLFAALSGRMLPLVPVNTSETSDVGASVL